MKNLKYAVGIDVSMKDFACCLTVINDGQAVKVKASHKFANTAAGFKALWEWADRHCKETLPVVFVMEATGVYHEQLAWFLNSKDQAVSILLPNKAKSYLKADGGKSKNDKIDARGLSKMGAEKKLDLWVPPSKELYTLPIPVSIKILQRLVPRSPISCTPYNTVSSKTKRSLNN